MPDGKVILIIAALAAAGYAGTKAYVETRDHVAKPIYHHALKPAACGLEKVFTLGEKSCKPPASK
jgi:hypothetical protein